MGDAVDGGLPGLWFEVRLLGFLGTTPYRRLDVITLALFPTSAENLTTSRGLTLRRAALPLIE